MTPAPAIQLQTVRLRLGTTDFAYECRIPAGGITAIAGPSGSGKSTLLNLIAGFERPDSGTILIHGEAADHMPPGQRPISLVFQDNNLFAHLDLATNIGLGIDPRLRLTAEQKKAVVQALDRVGLAGYETRKPGTLSGGERQRVALARALVRRRPILLLDEPFAALDPALKRSMADLLLDLHREAASTVLFVTHDIEDVRRLADSVLFIDQGRIVFAGATSRFLGQDAPAAISKFLSSS
ncbi:ATP-binding cassette domain-containing protein [Rhizobium sp. SSA_523]|uniref:thiamine ABC transporter ATP-binding protein n=1 Tax=Rhizobium sp. SSA_523 TaxID=2952477 RepID=UPI0020911E7B|nr:ATP-binding cassette domain-containing protein [Rhizobium sp. SSA_523]MCO5733483.1 ATP-binding cassette domain-containing protein [Rhizobium sp. SSA_523]WKC23212.1 ATP-binding cassette domain-containing protein [Rhizobium sp. SSA_523]